MNYTGSLEKLEDAQAHSNQQRRRVRPIFRYRITDPPFCTHFGHKGTAVRAPPV